MTMQNRSAVGIATMPDSANMRESINPKSRPRSATPPRLTDIDVVDETPSTSPFGIVQYTSTIHRSVHLATIIHPAPLHRQCPQEGTRHHSAAIVRSVDLRVSPGALQARRRGLLGRFLQQGNDVKTSPSPAKRSAFTGSRASQLAAGARCRIRDPTHPARPIPPTEEEPPPPCPRVACQARRYCTVAGVGEDAD